MIFENIHISLFVFLLLFAFCSPFVLSSNKICKNKRQFYLRNKFAPVSEEKTISVIHNNELFNKISNSFFGQIGSNPKHVENEDYHWFDGDGMIHGLFINNSLLTYQNKWIKTKRLEVEDKWNKKIYLYFGELKGVQGMFQIIKYSLMEFFKFIPKASGTANTAFLKWKNRLFALHEGDMPYELNIDNINKNISTIGRIQYPSLHSTTAHPVIDKRRDLLYLYGYNNYDFLKGNFIFNIFNTDMVLLNQKNISLINNGMTHDVGFTGDHIIIPDMPLKYDVSRILKQQLPMFFDKKGGLTRFGVFDVNTLKEPKWFHFDENFFIFHFATSYKVNDKFIIFACIMDELFMEDFVDLDNLDNEKHVIRGNIRLKEIRLDPNNNKTEIIENDKLEDLDLDFYYNLDFPLVSKLDSKYVYCTIFDTAAAYIRGYVKINTSNFKDAEPIVFLFDKEMHGNSEPQLTVIEDVEYILTFNNDDEKSYISLIDIENKNISSVQIPTRIPPGFHSIYYEHD